MTNILSLIVASLMGVAGFIMLAWLLAILFEPAKTLLDGIRAKSTFSRASKHLARATELMDKGEYKGAISELERSFVIAVQLAPAAISKIREHHQSILSRYLIIGEELELDSAGITSEVAQVEQLLLQRSELEMLSYRAKESYQRFVNKQSKVGKVTPKWSQEEYQEKILEIDKNLKENTSELRQSLRELFNKLTAPRERPVVYH